MSAKHATPPVIFSLVKIGKKEHLEQLQRTGSLRMMRFAAYQGMEDNVGRGDINEGMAAMFQPDQAVVKWGDHTLTGLLGPIKISYDSDVKKHVFCMHAITSHRLSAIFDEGASPIDPENFGLGEHALIITNVTAFIERLKEVAYRRGPSFHAGLVEYIDPNTHHGQVGPFRKSVKYSHQSEWRIVIEASDKEIFLYELGQGLEDISVLAPCADIRSNMKFSLRT